MTTLSDFIPPPPVPPTPCRELVCENKIALVAWDYARNARKEQPDVPVEVIPANEGNTLFRVERVMSN